MNLLSAESVSKSFSERILINNQTLGLSKGDKVALVGANGAGKTTLLRILAGEMTPDSGSVSLRKGISTTYLPQQPVLDDTITIAQLLAADDNPVVNAIRDYEAIMTDPNADPDKMQELMELMEQYDAWNYDSTQAQVLAKLNITDDSRLLCTLSGGQRKRVAMARMLLRSPDLMLLDEPTNHLDLDAIEWLENFLGSPHKTLLMVTHDRYFLDNVANVILELDGGRIYRYEGNYAYFLEKKSEREAITRAEIDKAKNLLSKELEWMRRQPKARGTKARYRIEAFYEIKDKANSGKVKEELQLNMSTARQGGKVMEIEHIHKKLGGKTLVKDFSYTFRKGERIGVAGRNGAGKSTFLNLITGRIQPDQGEIVKGETTRPGYYTQEVDNLNPDNRIIDEIKEIAEFITLGNGEQVSVSKLLQMFLFPPAQQYGFIGKLSGGEKRRLQLLKVLVANPNFLVLDEPTNDLDIDTLNVLEDFLESFPGCLLLVSHDRYFMDKLTDHLFIFEGNGIITPFNGNYSDYRNSRDVSGKGQAMNAAETGNEAPAPKPKPEATSAYVSTGEAKKKPSNKILRELEQVEKEIEAKEAEKVTLAVEMARNLPFESLRKLSEQLSELDARLETLMARWEELQEMV